MTHSHDTDRPCASVSRGLRLASGLRCQLRRPVLPGLRHYYVVALPVASHGPADIRELQRIAHRVARLLGQLRFGDPECHTLVYSGARTRRRPWPHVHVLLADSIAAKRRAVLLLQLKRLLRWRRWPVVRWALGTGVSA